MTPSLPRESSGDAAAGTEVAGADAPVRREAQSHVLRVLAILSALMGFASISTDVSPPAPPTIATALRSDPGTMASTIAGDLVGFSLGQLFWGRSATATGAASRQARLTSS